MLFVRYSIELTSIVLLKGNVLEVNVNKKQSIEQISHRNYDIGVHLSK